MRFFGHFLPLIAVLAGCVSLPERHTRTDWVTTTIFRSERQPSFALDLPSGFSVTDLGGIDSRAARIVGPGVTVLLDYGVGGRQTCEQLPRCKQGNRTLAGREITWTEHGLNVERTEKKYSTRLHLFFPLQASRTERPSPDAGVMFHADCVQSCDIVKEMAFSAAFQPPNSALR